MQIREAWLGEKLVTFFYEARINIVKYGMLIHQIELTEHTAALTVKP